MSRVLERVRGIIWFRVRGDVVTGLWLSRGRIFCGIVFLVFGCLGWRIRGGVKLRIFEGILRFEVVLELKVFLLPLLGQLVDMPLEGLLMSKVLRLKLANLFDVQHFLKIILLILSLFNLKLLF